MTSENLRPALDLAIEVALAAGERLREELFRPGGPRGSGDKADIDLEVETDIRRQLLEAFPEWSYQGEETGRAENGGPARWIVDPNDGTSCYLKGMRGSSVSIALLWEGEPVLGVVYAPLYPDNAGDCLSWAEGCGPMMRNGVAWPRPDWSEKLTSKDVVLVSQHGDRASAANLRCVQPARMRCMPSIAYRFALVAAGEACAGVSLASPVAHDFAACHALLRGQGGSLLDQDGQPIVYDERGSAGSPRCFGGSPEICRSLARRPWNEVFGRASGSKLAFPIQEQSGRAVRDARLFSRGLGSWVGQLAGDNLGALVEFKSAGAIADQFSDGPRRLVDGGCWNILAGQPTDDSELALCLARSMVTSGGFDRTAAWQAYVEWRDSHPFDMGITTRQGLSTGSPPDPGRHSDSQANGALMRCSPLALAGWNDVAAVMEWSDQDASITHPNPVCLAANRAYLRGMVAGLNGADPGQMLEKALEGSDGSVRAALERAQEEPPEDFVDKMGWVLIALQNAFYQLLHAPTLEQGVVDTVRSGGDTDTNGCIAGALLGAVYGLQAIPEQWRLAVLSCRPHPDFGAARQPRPTFCWPADVYPLVERLLTLRA